MRSVGMIERMRYFIVPILCILVLVEFRGMAGAQQPELQFKECAAEKGNYSDNSMYQRNLNNIFTWIYTNTEIEFGFFNFTFGEDPDKVNAIALCRPDFTPEYCRSCLKYVGDSLLTLCPNFKEAIGVDDDCMIRYSFRSIFRHQELSPRFFVNGAGRNVSDDDVVGFNSSRSILLQRMCNQAASGDSRYKFAAGDIPRDFQTIYAFVQCTPDLTGSECRNCLYNASRLIPLCCGNRTGGRVILPSCNLRFEIDPFVNQIPNQVPPSPPSISPGNRSKRSPTVIIVVTAVTVSAIMLAVSICIFIRTRKKEDKFQLVNSEIQQVESFQFDLHTIRAATDYFSEAKKLGEGGFGVVYMGTLPNGQEIAVKRLCRGSSGQGELEFKNEVVLVAKLQHRNLVKLLGFCLEGQERLLVYEFLPNSSLNNFIFDPIKRENLNWKMRYKIIGGIARGLVYLHEDSRLRIIHRDLKASNILLDDEMNPKISDFGTARLFAVDQTQEDTSRIVGTFGYMAPEYVRRGHFSVKSDVFSFGVLVLEIVSGQRNNGFGFGEEEEDLLTYAWRIWNEGRALHLIDPMMRDCSRSEMKRCIDVGLLCVQENEANRPTMAEVVTMLSSYSITLPIPSKPAFVNYSEPLGIPQLFNFKVTESDGSRSESQIIISRNDASITELYPR